MVDYFNSKPEGDLDDARDVKPNPQSPIEPALGRNDSRKRIDRGHGRSVSESAAASGRRFSSNARRPKLQLYTSIAPNVPRGTFAVKPEKPKDEDDGSRGLKACDSKKAHGAESSSRDKTRSTPSDNADPTTKNHVSKEEFEVFKEEAERKVTSLKEKISTMTEDAQHKNREHAKEIRDRDWETNMLKHKLKSTVADTVHQEPSKAALEMRQSRGTPRQPLLYVGRAGQREDGNESPDSIQYLYEGFLDQLTQTTVEMWIKRAEMAQQLKEWKAMFFHAEEALAHAVPLDYIPMSARCVYYRAIALLHLRKPWDAEDDFKAVTPCISIYKTQEEVDFWAYEIEKATQGTSPIQRQQSWIGRILTPFSLPTSKDAPSLNRQTSSTRSPVPATRALKDEIGSAMLSGTFPSSSLEVPSPYRSDIAPPPLPVKGRPSTAAERRHPASKDTSRPQVQRMSTLQLPGQMQYQYNPLQEQEALRQRQAWTRRGRSSTLLSSFDTIPDPESPKILARDVEKIDGILKKRQSNESLGGNSPDRSGGLNVIEWNLQQPSDEPAHNESDSRSAAPLNDSPQQQTSGPVWQIAPERESREKTTRSKNEH